MNENYFVKREIIAQFPPANEKEKNPIVSIELLCAILSFASLKIYRVSLFPINLVCFGIHCGNYWLVWLVHYAVRSSLAQFEEDGLLGLANGPKRRCDSGSNLILLVRLD